jgi:pimeloyl-ACP methyl ester carboxylesterase
MMMLPTLPLRAACDEASGGASSASPSLRPEGERAIDIGGYSLAIRCRGHGAPTVIFENGAMPFVDVFDDFRMLAGERWRACSYDRAGTGKSQPGPAPRDAATIADELDRLVEAAGETPPFVLVPLSVGALYSMMYAHRYPTRVAGIVMVDPRLPAYQLGVPTVFDDPKKKELIAKMPAPYRQEYEPWSDDARWLGDAGPLPDVPLVVLTASSPEQVSNFKPPLDDRDLWVKSHADLAASVPRGRHVLVEDAGHMIFQQNPHAVLDAIAWVVEQHSTGG